MKHGKVAVDLGEVTPADEQRREPSSPQGHQEPDDHVRLTELPDTYRSGGATDPSAGGDPWGTGDKR